MGSGNRKSKQKNQQEDRIPCDDFDWYKMLDDGALKKQRVAILNKYTDHYQLPLVRDKKKLEKLRAINEDESYDDVAFNKLENQVMHHIFGLFI